MVYDTFDAWQIYQACKLHYTRNYDMSKYGYNIKSTSWANFQKVKNKRIFTTLAKRYREMYPEFIKFSLYGHDSNWVGDLQDEEIIEEFWNHRKYIESLSSSFEKELDGIEMVMYNNQILFKSIFISEDITELPIVERLYIQGLLSIETMLILHRLIHWMDKVECSNPIWESSKTRKLKYNKFLSLNNSIAKKIFIKHVKENLI